MAIKVIKHGETKFKITCPVCGCEFEYEFEDLITQYDVIKQVKCPDCGEWLTHRDVYPTYPNNPNKPIIDTPIDPIGKPYITWTTSTPGAWPDCETCPNKPDPNKIVVGDTPCTWCHKNQPYCTCNCDNIDFKYKVDTSAANEVKTTFDAKQKE